MSHINAIEALHSDVLGLVRDGSIVGLGSGRAASALVRSLARLVKEKNYKIHGIPTSMQIKLVAEEEGLHLVGADQVSHIDVVFDGADQIDSKRYVIKGGGGALLLENILFNLAKKVVVIADMTKFVKNFTMAVPVEIHPQARKVVGHSITRLGGKPELRLLDRGYPLFTENGNMILDCDFGTIEKPSTLTRAIKQIPGVMESGIFLKRPDIIYRTKPNGKFDFF